MLQERVQVAGAGGMNCRSEFPPILERGGFHVRAGEELIPGCGRFHVHAGGSKSRPAVGTTALTVRTQATVYVPCAREMTEDMMEERPELSCGGKEDKNVFGGH